MNGETHKCIFDGWSITAETNKDGELKSREVRGYGLVKKETDNNQYYYHQNEHGDITHLTNTDEEIENSYQYDVFGNIREQQENVENIFKYAGEQLDNETQQYYLHARFYNPVIARFTQEDVYRDDGLNLYVYVVNNPLLWIDPSGYEKCSQNNNESIVISDMKVDFIVTPNGVVMPTNKNYDLVDSQIPTNKGGSWIQIHNTHIHDGLTPHTHFPEVSVGENGYARTDRRYKATDASDIEYADKVLRDGSMRERINRKDKGGPIK